MTTSDLVQECDDGQLPGDNSYYGRYHVDPAGAHSYHNVLRAEPMGMSSDTKDNTDDKKGLADTKQSLQMVSSDSCPSHGAHLTKVKRDNQ